MDNHHYDLWRSGFVNRWHTFGDPRLRNSGDTTGAHAWRVAILVTRFSDELDLATALLTVVQALYHDADELVTGDLPYVAKRAVPNAAAMIALYGAAWLQERGVPDPTASLAIVKWCDMMDHYLFAATYAPDIMGDARWEELRRSIMSESSRRGKSAEVEALLDRALEGVTF